MQQVFLWHLVKDHHLIQLHLFISHNYSCGLWWLQSSKPLWFVYKVTEGYLQRMSFSNRDTEWCQTAFSKRVKLFYFANTGWSLVATHYWQKGRTGKSGRTGAVQIPSQRYPPKPGMALGWQWRGTGTWAALRWEFRRANRDTALQTGCGCSPLPSTLHSEWSVAEPLITYRKSCGKWIMCISLKTLIWFTL